MRHLIITSFSLLHDGREVICSDMMTVEGMLILHLTSLSLLGAYRFAAETPKYSFNENLETS